MIWHSVPKYFSSSCSCSDFQQVAMVGSQEHNKLFYSLYQIGSCDVNALLTSEALKEQFTIIIKKLL